VFPTLTFRFALAGLCCLAVSSLAVGRLLAQDDADLEESKKLVVMIEGKFTEGGTQGAGIVFHVDALGRAWIVTANHVVRQRRGAAATGLVVRFYGQPPDDVPATLRKELSLDQDVAVLVAPAPKAMRFPFDRLAVMALLKEGSNMRAVGYPDGSKRWGQTRTPSPISDVGLMRISVEAPVIRKGHSGGALLDETHLLAGMVLDTDGTIAEALRADQLIEILRRDLKLEVSLGRQSNRPPQRFEITLAPAKPPPPLSAGATLTNPRDGLTYVWIPPGMFRMGCSEAPRDTECEDDEKLTHSVTLTKGFWIGQTEVTQAAYQRLMGKNPSGNQGAQLPVETVDHPEASAYCAAAGGLRLPTEAEWEYAARAGSREARYGEINDIAWYSGSGGAHAVGKKVYNAKGLHDMLGNVWEWTADWYAGDFYGKSPASNPSGPETGTYRVLRGGSWSGGIRDVRVSNRGWVVSAYRDLGIGFRCAGEFR